jgi:hypothetical protein
MAASKAIPITLNGEEHTLRFTNRAIVELEDRFGITMVDAGEKLQRGSLKTIAALVWAGMLHEPKAWSFEKVRDAIDLTDLETPAKALADAMVAAFGKAEPESSEGNQAPAVAA